MAKLAKKLPSPIPAAMKEYRGWLKAAGFKTVKLIKSAPAASPLILATK